MLRAELTNLHERNINVSTREIWLHLPVDDENPSEADVDYRTAVQFEKNLRFLDKQSDRPILVHQHVIGGNWDDGMAIYDAIKACRSYITILAYAHARSMSSIFFQAADRRVLMPNAYVLLHYGWLGFVDRETPAIQYAKQAERDSQQMLRLYAQAAKGSKRFKRMSVDEIARFIDKKLKDLTDWRLSAEEAVAYGFADGVLGKGRFKTIDKLFK